MKIPQIKEIETLCSKLEKRMTDERDWHLVGGNLPVDPSTLEGLAQLSRELEGVVEAGTGHRMRKYTLRKYRWKRVYDEDGKIDYELIGTTP